MSDVLKNHLEQFVLVFVGYYLANISVSLVNTPFDQIISNGFIPALLVGGISTAIRAAYNKTVIGNSMGVRS